MENIRTYNAMIQEVCNIGTDRARLVEAYLRMQYRTLDALSAERIKFEYLNGGSEGSIRDAIDLDPDGSEKLARSYAL